jgi:putative inorganic carbon (HCO3(-)) transporter
MKIREATEKVIDFLPDISDPDKMPVGSVLRPVLVTVMVLLAFSSFILLTNALNLHLRLYLFITLIWLSLFFFKPNMTILFIYYIIIVLIRPAKFIIGNKIFNMTDLYVVGLIIVFLGSRAITEDREWRRSDFNKYVYFFIAICLMGTLRGLYVGSLPVNVFHETIYYTLYAPLFFVFFNSIKEEKEIDFLIWLFFGIALLIFIWGVAEYLRGTGYTGFIQYNVKTRVGSTLGNPNVYAGFLELIIPLAICYLLVERRYYRRFFLVVLIALGYVNLFMTFSRGGFISALISLFLILFFRVKKKAYSFIVLAFTIIVLMAASAFIARQLAVFNIQEALIEGSLINRILSYSGNVKTIAENPLFGIGWGARFGYVPYGYYEPSHYVLMFFGHGNSTFLDIFTHLGLIGLLAFYGMIFALLRNLLKQARTISDPVVAALPWGLFAGFSGLTFHLLFDGFIKWPRMGSVFWIFAGLAFANWYLYTKREASRQNPAEITVRDGAKLEKKKELDGP